MIIVSVAYTYKCFEIDVGYCVKYICGGRQKSKQARPLGNPLFSVIIVSHKFIF